jgi:uncharacterized protein
VELNNTFEVAVPPEQVWELLLDVERVAPCMPGAELTDVVDDTTWKGKVTVKLGAVSLSYKGEVSMTERDDDAHRAVMEAKGMETRGKGTAAATVVSSLEALDDGGTKVEIATDLKLSGQAAQMGRGMIGDVSQRMTNEFAECLRSQLEGPDEVADEAATAAAGGQAQPPTQAPAPQAKPISGIRLGVWALWRALLRGILRVLRRAVAWLERRTS